MRHSSKTTVGAYPHGGRPDPHQQAQARLASELAAMNGRRTRLDAP